jgi:hypothetical protein
MEKFTSSFDGKWDSVNKQTLGYFGISLNDEKPIYYIDLNNDI